MVWGIVIYSCNGPALQIASGVYECVDRAGSVV